MLPYGVPFDSLSFLYPPSGHFFDFKNLLGLSRFLTLQFFILTDDGMGGRSTFFFHFFTTDVLKRLVGGPKVASKIYRVVFQKKAKKKEVLTDPPVNIKNWRGQKTR